MSKSTYRDQDHAFGQKILTLRTATGLTQTGLGEYLGVSRHAVGEWEAGNTYPKAEHLRKFISLATEQHAFQRGQEEFEIRALWHASRQKVLLDEAWLSLLLKDKRQTNGVVASASTSKPQHTATHSPDPTATRSTDHSGNTLVDWGDVLSVSTFYGREDELGLLTEWVVEERCRLIGVLGLGGIGKTSIGVRLIHRLAERFDLVIWRSVRNSPNCRVLLDDIMQVLALHDPDHATPLQNPPASTEEQLNLLLSYLQNKRILLLLDNLETLLEEGDNSGRMRAGYEDYGRLIQLAAETRHRSCLVFTSREKPLELVHLEGRRSPVRVLRLAPLDAEACQLLLGESKVGGTPAERVQIIDAYAGNPLALKIVAQSIADLFDGELALFLEQDALIFGGVRDLVEEQFKRLSRLEQSIMFWLAIMREPLAFNRLRELLVAPPPRVQLLEAMDALRRRSLVERGQQPGSFTLQSVVLEFVTARLVAEAREELASGNLHRLIEHGLTTALAPEYIRQTQAHLLLGPVLEQLYGASNLPQSRQASFEQQIEALLNKLRDLPEEAQGYGPANLANLLAQKQGHLRGVNLSYLSLRGAYLQGVDLKDADMSGAAIRDSVFTETFDAILSVAVNSGGNGTYLAACSMRGDIRLWSAGDYRLQRSWRDPLEHADAFALSPDGSAMVAANYKHVLKLWDVKRDTLIWTSVSQGSTTTAISFSPDGRSIATTCMDRIVRLWDAGTGTLLKQLQLAEKERRVELRAVSYSPDNRWLAVGDAEGSIYIWAMGNSDESADPMLVSSIAGHTQIVTELAFAPDGNTLASVSRDGHARLWDVPSGHLRLTLPGEHGPLRRLAWSADGKYFAFGGQDRLIWLWDTESARYSAALHGHASTIKGLAFTPDSRQLFSGSDDGTLRVWDTVLGRCVRVIQGYTLLVQSARWSPDSTKLASASSDNSVTIQSVGNTISNTGAQIAQQPLLIAGHRRWISGLAWNPDGSRLASSDIYNVIRIWDTTSGECLETFGYSDDPNNIFWGLDWSPDGRWLAAGSPQHGALLWDMRHPGNESSTGKVATSGKPAHQWGDGAEGVLWSPDGSRLGVWTSASTLCVWDVESGSQVRCLVPEFRHITGFAWSPDGSMLAALSIQGGEGGVFVWNVRTGELVRTITGSTDVFYVALAWGDNDTIVVGSIDGRVRWWNIATGGCVTTNNAHLGAAVADLQVSPDGTRLASCGYDGAIMLWSSPVAEHIQTLRRDRPYERLNITGIRGLTEAQKATLVSLGAVEDKR